jgi:uncharacterized SAM-binding protein YcdF (DUF218 family)
MFFIFSKVLSFLMNQILWILVFLLMALFSNNVKKKKKFLLWGILVLYIFTNSVLINLVSWYWDIRDTTVQAGKKYSCAIVLGGFSSDDGRGGGFFNMAADRFIQGLRLQKMGVVDKILLTGGNGFLSPSSYREADWAKQQYKDLQLPDSCLLIENQSRNTIENAAFTKQLLQTQKLKGPYLLVTSAFHMRRSMMIFKKQGIEVIPYPCNFLTRSFSFSVEDLLPNTAATAAWGMYIKEVIGYIVTVLFK